MSKLVENKQLIHIGTEVVVLVGLTFYFSQKNKKLIGHIEDLAQRVEDQEDMLQKHEQIIRKLVETINNRPPTPTPTPTHQAYQKPKKVPVSRHRSAPLQVPQRPKSPPKKISFNESPSFEQLPSSSEEEDEEDEEEDDDDLDSEIQAELEELVESESEGEQGLKKRQ